MNREIDRARRRGTTKRQRKEQYRAKRGRSVAIPAAMALSQFGADYVGHVKAGNLRYVLWRLTHDSFVVSREGTRRSQLFSEQILVLRGCGRTTALQRLKAHLIDRKITYNKIIYVSAEVSKTADRQLH
jgi:hypothetical protein